MESQHKLGADSAGVRASKTTKNTGARRPMGRTMRQVAVTAGVAALGLSLISGPGAIAETVDNPGAVTSTDAPVAPNGTAADAVTEQVAPSTEAAPAAEAAPADAAAAADAVVADGPVQFDNVSITEDRQFDRGAVNVDFSLSVPDASKAGDTFTIIYPSLLRYDNSKPAVIKLSDGTVVATGALTDPATRTITFTFTDAVDTYRNVKVSGYFGMIIDDPAANSTSKPFVFFQNGQQFTDDVITDPSQRPPLTSVYIYGEWNNEDRGRDVPKGAITWTANLPEGKWSGQTVTVSPSDATSLFDCSTVSFYTTEVPDGAIYHSSVLDENQAYDGRVSDNTTPSYADVVSCSQTELVVKYSEPVDNNFVRQIKIVADAADTDVTSQFGANVANSDLVLVAGDAAIVPTTWFNFVARDVAAGEGEGETRDAAISLTKYSAAEGAIDGDFDSAPGKTLAADQSEKIVFAITNTGTEDLTSIKLADTTLSGAPVKLDECVLDAVVLQPGATVTCEGTLVPTMPGQYADNATVTAVSVRDATPVTSSDAWYGNVPAPAVPPVVPTVPASLASTGLATAALPIYVGGSALMMLAGAAVFFITRRRAAIDG